jgi:hypothetical protein
MKITLTAIAIILIASIASAVCLNGNPSVSEEYANSQSVFIGKIIEEQDVPESGNYYDGKNYTVQVQRTFKGTPSNPVVIFSENSSGRFPMTVGKTYIIFLHYELGRYQIDNCGNSGLQSEKQDIVQSLRQLRETMIK